MPSTINNIEIFNNQGEIFPSTVKDKTNTASFDFWYNNSEAFNYLFYFDTNTYYFCRPIGNRFYTRNGQLGLFVK